MHVDDYESVPSAPSDAEPDPHWSESRTGSTLPATYMPPSMSGEHSTFIRLVALVVIAVFIGATAVGVCLTYGPPVFGL